jgi:CDP-diacylglycerol pyrophosphatase
MRYDLLSSHSTTELLDQVNEALKQDWTPLGGVSVTTLEGQPFFIQAVTHEEDLDKTEVSSTQARADAAAKEMSQTK